MSRARMACWGAVATLWACGAEDLVDEAPELEPAAVGEPSAPCPSFDGTGDYVFRVGGEDREAWIGFPQGGEGPYRVIFAFHGLTDVSFDAAGQLVRALGLTELVEEREVIVVAPQARPTNFGIGMVKLWGILTDQATQEDLAFYDDMRACLVREAGADPERIHATGFSGGGLWTSVLVMERSETLASAVALSGGVDTYGPSLDWREPAHPTPVALMDGGPSDTWPDPSLALLNFHEASASFGGHLASAGHVSAACVHQGAHTLPPRDMWNLGRRWLLNHRFGEPSPWEGESPWEVPSGCSLLP